MFAKIALKNEPIHTGQPNIQLFHVVLLHFTIRPNVMIKYSKFPKLSQSCIFVKGKDWLMAEGGISAFHLSRDAP